MHLRTGLTLAGALAAVAATSCGASDSASNGALSPADPSGYVDGGSAHSAEPSYGDSGAWGAADAGGGSFGNIGTGGAQDFAAFRAALAAGNIPTPSMLDAAGFFAEHYTTLPPPTCGQTFCLHGMLSVSKDLARGGDWTLLQMGMNSPIDPSTVQRPPLDLAVVLDHSGSMSEFGKMDYAKQGVKLLVDALTTNDTFTFIIFDETVQTLFGPAKVTDKAALKAIVDGVQPNASTDIFDGLKTGYEAALSVGDETQQRRVIFLTDGLANTGDSNPADIEAMSAAYNEKYIGLTTIGLGADADGALLRALAEKGGGNYYFVEDPAAVTEVFTEELAYFVAPIAYDLDLTYEPATSYSIKEMFGTSLWTANAGGGGTIHVPSVSLVSRTSTDAGATGGRRGGGSAIVASLVPDAPPVTRPYAVAQLHLRYRKPGSTTYETQDVPVTWDGDPGVAPDGGYYSDDPVRVTTEILDLFIAFRDATNKAQTDPAAALAFLQAFQPKIQAELAGTTDADLLDDLTILQQYIDVLKKHVGP